MISCRTEPVLAGLDGLLWEGDHVFTSKAREKIERARETEDCLRLQKAPSEQTGKMRNGVLGIKLSSNFIFSTLWNIPPYRKTVRVCVCIHTYTHIHKHLNTRNTNAVILTLLTLLFFFVI